MVGLRRHREEGLWHGDRLGALADRDTACIMWAMNKQMRKSMKSAPLVPFMGLVVKPSLRICVGINNPTRSFKSQTWGGWEGPILLR